MRWKLIATTIPAGVAFLAYTLPFFSVFIIGASGYVIFRIWTIYRRVRRDIHHILGLGDDALYNEEKYKHRSTHAKLYRTEESPFDRLFEEVKQSIEMEGTEDLRRRFQVTHATKDYIYEAAAEQIKQALPQSDKLAEILDTPDPEAFSFYSPELVRMAEEAVMISTRVSRYKLDLEVRFDIADSECIKNEAVALATVTAHITDPGAIVLDRITVVCTETGDTYEVPVTQREIRKPGSGTGRRDRVKEPRVIDATWRQIK
ncbi:hypothetical protein BJ085DRAFT_32192 [Dimargaris cristalligena]|uniref:Uncharacterized protein n=1 Tax=Dimargaris cristalligena TaxID=215637 RepID=A0A4P9ZKR7_9FUNG|nr:hypothetical protein BJ085DRAFT_32192 [Dimargaris cristalligena]|eukprot:RKP33658.1 hypothetical protein BJ085DRAFT_32192 [Dimargaris cristalligena]